jgi:tRNA 2-thiouridine synthesizing protein E
MREVIPNNWLSITRNIPGYITMFDASIPTRFAWVDVLEHDTVIYRCAYGTPILLGLRHYWSTLKGTDHQVCNTLKESVTMVKTMDDIMHPSARARVNAEFPCAPVDWTTSVAKHVAQCEGLDMQSDHWVVVRALQEYVSRHEPGGINLRELHDALEERFHNKGGIRYLYTLFPGGPVAQGCRLAGLEPPTRAADKGFGSVS